MPCLCTACNATQAVTVEAQHLLRQHSDVLSSVSEHPAMPQMSTDAGYAAHMECHAHVASLHHRHCRFSGTFNTCEAEMGLAAGVAPAGPAQQLSRLCLRSLCCKSRNPSTPPPFCGVCMFCSLSLRRAVPTHWQCLTGWRGYQLCAGFLSPPYPPFVWHACRHL